MGPARQAQTLYQFLNLRLVEAWKLCSLTNALTLEAGDQASQRRFRFYGPLSANDPQRYPLPNGCIRHGKYQMAKQV
jgi:hypothetical protein